MKSDETYVQIFTCHFDPFWIICSRKVFSEIIFIIFFQTSPSPVLSGANDPNLCFVLFHYFFNVHCSNFCFYTFLLVFGTYTKSFMSLRSFGAEKSLVKVDHVLGGVHPNRNSAVAATLLCFATQYLE